MQRIFISSVQKEFAAERAALADYLRTDPLLRRFFEPFLFEELPALDQQTSTAYLAQVASSDIYLGLFGDSYGFEDAQGVSPTEHEFNRATEAHKTRLIYVKGETDQAKHPKMRALIQHASNQVVRRRFQNSANLHPAVYASLVDYLQAHELLRFTPFDASACRDATQADLSLEKIQSFLRTARSARNFPLAEDAAPHTVLTQLRLLKNDAPTHAAVLLFGKEPQRFIYNAEVKCAHFHGTQRQKPIPFYQVYKGTLFELVDQAVNFVLSKINLAVGTRALSAQAPTAYEIPPEVVSEAIVNAIAHRDYTSTASVQVMLFADRLEVWNPGGLPPGLSLQSLREPHGSYPANPLIAEPLYLAKYIERMGTGTGDMIERCTEHGLPEPTFGLTDGFVTTIWRKPELALVHVGGEVAEGTEQATLQATPQVTLQVTLQVTPQVAQLLNALQGEMSRTAVMAALGLKDRVNFSKNYLEPALSAGLIERTLPGSPHSPTQKYRLTGKGQRQTLSLP
jgi:predicted HTH transcriptional regulator